MKFPAAVSNFARSFFSRVRRLVWTRRFVITVIVIFAIYSLAGFFGMPWLVRRILTNQVATSLKRPVTVGAISFNPYTLRLQLDDLHIADRDPQRPFVDAAVMRIKVAWSSIVHLAPIIGEFYSDRLVVHAVRIGPQEFNFSDLLTSQPSAQPAREKKPTRFAVSNIQLNDGEIDFDDQVLKQEHKVAHIRLAVPFIANFPSYTNVFVQPFLQMVVDGSHFRIDGRTKPFGKTLDTIMDLNLHRLDLSKYVGYAPIKLPFKLDSGFLSSQLHLHFVQINDQPMVRFDGAAALEAFDIRDSADLPLFSFGRLSLTLNNVQPLDNIIHLKRIYLEAPHTNLIINADGSNNFAKLMASSAKPPATPGSQGASPASLAAAAPVATIRPTPAPSATASPASSPAPSPTITPTATGTASATATPSSTASPSATVSGSPGASPAASASASTIGAAATPEVSPAAKPAMDFRLGSFELADGVVKVTDQAVGPTPAVLNLNSLHATVTNLSTRGKQPASYDMNGAMGGGGSFGAKGSLDVAGQVVQTEAWLNQIDLPALQPFTASILNAGIASGKLDANATIKTDLAKHADVHVEPANLAIENLNLHGPLPDENPVGWGKLAVAVQQVDLAAHQAQISAVRGDGLKLIVRRDRAGKLNLLNIVKTAPSAAATPAAKPIRRTATRSRRGRMRAAPTPTPAPAAPSPPRWHYKIASVVLDKAEIHSIDEHNGRPVKTEITPLGITLKNISDDLSKPIDVAMQATVNNHGTIKIDGTAAPAPLEAKLRVAIKRLDLTAANPFIEDNLNATIAAAALSLDGVVTAAERNGKPKATYRGDLALTGVRMLDKVNRAPFVRWRSFTARRIAAAYGGAKPDVKIGGLALNDFYARVILNSNGRLNLSDITSSPHEAPKSITEPGQSAASPSATPTPAATTAPAAAPPAHPEPLPINLDLGGIALSGGKVNYSDNFIQPHYSADLSSITGKIGAISTGPGEPADVNLQGEVNGSAPLTINGKVNPLTPLAFVDLSAKANGVELPSASPYSIKYTGYPITKGTLTVDVHYLLKDQQLTAQNHIFIDQLTFGQKVESKTALNLPIRLAVALLKDRNGAIDLNIPISGSLNNPQFSIGGVILQVFKNLIVKAATAPFSLIASAFAHGAATGQQLNHVDFKPGYAKITAEEEKQLDTIAQALSDRPALKLDIAGRVDPALDTPGLREAKVDRLVLAQKIKDVGEPENGEPITLSKDDYDKYLKRAYKAAKFDKPRNAIGLTKSLPADDMRKLLVENQKVTEDDLHHLADQRANAVRAALTAKKIDPSRLFIVPPKLTAEGVPAGQSATAADLALE